jgi:hypothetical protein
VKKKIFWVLLLEIALGLIASGAVMPIQATSEWTVEIDGAIFSHTTLNMTEIMAMPSVTVYAELYCDGNYVTAGSWTGVNLRFILEFVGLHQNAMSLDFYATDGYSREISITEAMKKTAVLAYEFNGKPLSETLRLVFPGANGEFWVARVNHIAISTNSVPDIQSGPSVNLSLKMQQAPTPTLPPIPSPLPSPKATPSPSQSISPSVSPTPVLTPQITTGFLPPEAFYVIAAAIIAVVAIIAITSLILKRQIK